MTPPRLHPEAEQEALAARRYYAMRSPAAALRFAVELAVLLRRIGAQSTAFPEHALIAVSAGERHLLLGVRKAVMPTAFPYMIFYYVRNHVPIVLAIAHGSRRPGYWMNRADEVARPGPAKAKR